MDLKGKNILVTGGAGAIGGILSDRLAENSNVIILDNLSSGYEENISNRVSFIEGNITDNLLLDHIFTDHDIDVIFHLAACFANQNSIEHSQLDLSTNGMGTLNLLEMCLKYKVEKFVYASSSCVIGENKITPYAITKALGEEYVRFYNRYYGLSTIILRYYNSYGPGDRPGKYRSVIPNFIKKALKNEDFIITGTGEETRDFTFVEDIVDATILASSQECDGMTFDIGTGTEIKIIDLANKIRELCLSKSEILFVNNRKWDVVKNRVANIEPIKRVLGYSSKIDLNEGLLKTIDWMKSNLLCTKGEKSENTKSS